MRNQRIEEYPRIQESNTAWIQKLLEFKDPGIQGLRKKPRIVGSNDRGIRGLRDPRIKESKD